MKRWFFLLLLTLIIGVVAGTSMGVDSGYVLLSWDKYSLETSLGLWLLATTLFVLALYMLWRFSLLILGSDSGFNEWRKQRRIQRSRRETLRGLLYMAQGQWKRSEKILSQHAENSDTPLINYLAAAKSAAEQGHIDEAIEWLKTAEQGTRGAELAVGIMQAEILSGSQQQEQALAILLNLQKKHPKHAHILKLLVNIYEDLEDWKTLQTLLPDANRYTNLSERRLQRLEEKVTLRLLEKAADQSVDAVKKQFHGLNRKVRYRLVVIKTYAELLFNRDQALLEQELRSAFKYVWHDDLTRLYGLAKGEDSGRQLLFAEKQLNERPNDPVLLLTLGRLAIRANQKDKAENYFKAGLKLRNLAEIHQEMALFCLAEGNEARACEHFQLALGD